MTAHRLRIALWSLVVLAVGALIWTLILAPRLAQDRITGTIGAGDYTLVTTDGQPFTHDDLSGTPTAVFFGFTHCPDVCPTTLGDIMGWQDDLATEGQRLRVLFFTVDPERDTSEILGEYVSWVPGVTGITGTPQEMAKAIKAFRIVAQKMPSDDGGYTVNHSTSVMLFDDQGQYAGLIGYQQDHDRAMGTIRTLLAS